MTILFNQTNPGIAAALTTLPVQMRDGNPESAILQGLLSYVSGGASGASLWVQTSVDGQGTWTDVANFTFAQATARFLFNLSALTPVATQYTPTDGSLGANTAKDGLLGQWWRVKYTIAAAYSGGSILRVDMQARGRLTSFAA
jgi:hypothetical protein